MLSQEETFDSSAVIEFLKRLMQRVKGKRGIAWNGARRFGLSYAKRGKGASSW